VTTVYPFPNDLNDSMNQVNDSIIAIEKVLEMIRFAASDEHPLKDVNGEPIRNIDFIALQDELIKLQEKWYEHYYNFWKEHADKCGIPPEKAQLAFKPEGKNESVLLTMLILQAMNGGTKTCHDIKQEDGRISHFPIPGKWVISRYMDS
jgi:hypothetical protein